MMKEVKKVIQEALRGMKVYVDSQNKSYSYDLIVRRADNIGKNVVAFINIDGSVLSIKTQKSLKHISLDLNDPSCDIEKEIRKIIKEAIW